MAGQAILTFLGATRTVTGSRYLLKSGDHHVLLDCGLFQGLKELRRRNWEPFPFDPARIDAVVLTHAHLDHTGYLPRLVRSGFAGPIYASPGTVDLLGILLPDAAHLEEENAAYANRKGFSRHKPALPLFTLDDVKQTLSLLRPVSYGQETALLDGWQLHYRPAGHILGSTIVELTMPGGGRLVTSGDLGRYDYPILPDPTPVQHADLLLLESTYGDRQHCSWPATREELARVVNDSVERGGVLLVPAFAVGRTQTLLYLLRELEDAGTIPTLPVIVDSPMAVSVCRFYQKHTEDHDEEARQATRRGPRALYPRRMEYSSTVDESKKINNIRSAAIIVSASGMMTGGRVLHHALRRLPDEQNTLLLVGYQAEGTRGRDLVQGKTELKIFGEQVPVRAKVEQVHGLSAHADADEILRWLGSFERAPRSTCIVHGEPDASSSLAERIRSGLGWQVRVPRLLEHVAIG